jgi:chromosome segregation ATPase
VDTLALFDQHRDFHQDQVPVMAGLQQRVSELELELARRQSLELKMARLNKLLAERELELAKYDESIAEAELRREAVEETSRGLAAELDARSRKMFALKTHTDGVEARYSATSCSNTVLRAYLSAAAAQKRVSEEARRVAEEAQQAAEEKLQEVESSLQASQADLQKAKSKFRELRKKSKHNKSKAAHYKAKADRFYSQILAFTKVRDQTWVNGFGWGFNSLKGFVLNPLTPSPNFAKLNYTDFMDVPEQAILELRGIG